MINFYEKRKRAKRDSTGVSLLELVVSMSIFSLLTILIFNMFDSTNKTAGEVQMATVSVSAAQQVAKDLTSSVRDSKHFLVSPDGLRLDIQKQDNTCEAWVFNGDNIFKYRGTAGVAPDSSWRQKATNVSQVDRTLPVFIQNADKLTYQFNVGAQAGLVLIDGITGKRIFTPSVDDINSLPCFQANAAGSPTEPIIPIKNPAPAPDPDPQPDPDPEPTPDPEPEPTPDPEPEPEPEPTPTPSTPPLTATYKVTNGWGNVSAYTVTLKNNTSQPIRSWRVSWEADSINGFVSWGAICGYQRSTSRVVCTEQTGWGESSRTVPANGTLSFSGQVEGGSKRNPTQPLVAEVRN